MKYMLPRILFWRNHKLDELKITYVAKLFINYSDDTIHVLMEDKTVWTISTVYNFYQHLSCVINLGWIVCSWSWMKVKWNVAQISDTCHGIVVQKYNFFISTLKSRETMYLRILQIYNYIYSMTQKKVYTFLNVITVCFIRRRIQLYNISASINENT